MKVQVGDCAKYVDSRGINKSVSGTIIEVFHLSEEEFAVLKYSLSEDPFNQCFITAYRSEFELILSQNSNLTKQDVEIYNTPFRNEK